MLAPDFSRAKLGQGLENLLGALIFAGPTKLRRPYQQLIMHVDVFFKETQTKQYAII